MFLYLTSGKESFNLSGDVTVSNDLNPDLRFSAIFGSLFLRYKIRSLVGNF